jgi:hypothetical protein
MAALFLTTQRWKQSVCPSADEDKRGAVPTQWHSTGHEEEEVLTHCSTRVICEDLLSKRGQTQEITYLMTWFTSMSRMSEYVQTAQRVVVFRAGKGK